MPGDIETRLHLALLQAARRPTEWLQVPENAVWTADLLELAREAAAAKPGKSPEELLQWVVIQVQEFLVDAGRRMGLDLTGVHVQARIDGGWSS